MKRKLFQITSSLMALLFVLILPYFIGTNLASDELRNVPEITREASASGEVLGISDTRGVTDNSTQQSLPYTSLFIALVGGLFIVTVVTLSLDKKLQI